MVQGLPVSPRRESSHGAEVPELLDVVQLAVRIGRWPAGTAGTLVEAYEDGGIVEVAHPDRDGIELVAAPYGALLRRDSDLAATAQRAGELGENRQVSVQTHPLKTTDAQRQ